ncbi:MAG: hypothetical protein R2867_27105 [Caldilineaceae bacterium]
MKIGGCCSWPESPGASALSLALPAAGFVFGMEGAEVGRIRYEGDHSCLVASFVGDWVAARAWGTPMPIVPTWPKRPSTWCCWPRLPWPALPLA